MTVGELIESLQQIVDHGSDPDMKVMAYNADTGQMEEVTGYDYGGPDNTLEIGTDEP